MHIPGGHFHQVEIVKSTKIFTFFRQLCLEIVKNASRLDCSVQSFEGDICIESQIEGPPHTVAGVITACVSVKI